MQLTLRIDSVNGRGRGNGPSAIVDFTALPQAKELVVTLFIVLNDNNGNPFSLVLLQQVINKLIDAFGGATVLPPCIGYWIDTKKEVDGNRKVVEDYLSLVQVVIPREDESICRLTGIVTEWAKDLEQHEIFLYIVPAYQPMDLLALNGPVLWQRDA